MNDFPNFYSPIIRQQKPIVPFSPTNFSIKTKLHSEISKWSNKELPFPSEPSMTRVMSLSRIPANSEIPKSPLPFRGPFHAQAPKEFVQSYSGLRQDSSVDSKHRKMRSLKVKMDDPTFLDDSTQASFMPSSIRRNGSLTIITSPKYQPNKDTEGFVAQSAMNQKASAYGFNNITIRKSPSSVQLKPVHVQGKSKKSIPRGFSPIKQSNKKIVVYQPQVEGRRNTENILVEEEGMNPVRVSFSVKNFDNNTNIHEFHARRELLMTREGSNEPRIPAKSETILIKDLAGVKKPRIEKLSLQDIKRKPSLENRVKFTRVVDTLTMNSQDFDRGIDLTYLSKRKDTEMSSLKRDETFESISSKRPRKIMTMNPYHKMDVFNTLRYGDFGEFEKVENFGESLKSSMKKGSETNFNKSKVMKTLCKKVVTFGQSYGGEGIMAFENRNLQTEMY